MNLRLILALTLVYYIITISGEEMKGKNSPLLLTPLIKAGQIEEAKALAKVGDFEGVTKRDSYSGFITVNEEYNSNLFFWFFPAQNKSEDAPVILWLDGGPGASVFITQFNQNGPYKVSPDGSSISDRATTWVDTYSMIYLENPVGTGYSFTDNDEGYSKSSKASGESDLEFLKQFFKLFPEYAKNDFYLGGISYGGHFVPPAAVIIHESNQIEPEDAKINLKGVFLYCPWSDPISQVEDFGPYLFNLGLVDQDQRDHFDSEYIKIADFINQEKFKEAKDIMGKLVSKPGSHFLTSSGFGDAMSALKSRPNMAEFGFITWVQTPLVREAIHVGDLTYDIVNKNVQIALDHDFMTSVKPDIEKLLQANYKVSIISGQMDLSVPHIGVEKMIQSLKWSGKDEYAGIERKIWKFNDDIAGYAKIVNNLSYFMVRIGGHMLIGDQNNWCLDIVNKVTQDGVKI